MRVSLDNPRVMCGNLGYSQRCGPKALFCFNKSRLGLPRQPQLVSLLQKIANNCLATVFLDCQTKLNTF